MRFDTDIPLPALDEGGISKSDEIRTMKPGHSVFLATRAEANVFRSLANKVLGPGRITIRQVHEEKNGHGWRAWRVS